MKRIARCMKQEKKNVNRNANILTPVLYIIRRNNTLQYDALGICFRVQFLHLTHGEAYIY